MKTVLVPARNRADVQELSDEIKKSIDIRLVDSAADLVNAALADWP